MNELSKVGAGAIEETARKAQAYAENALAGNTMRAYKADWRNYSEWCAKHELEALPAEPTTVALYLTALAESGRKASTISRKLSTIKTAHRRAGVASPTDSEVVHATWKGIRRGIGTARQGAAPIMPDQLRLMLQVMPETLAGVRDRAILLLGFAGALRRSELVGLEVEDLEETTNGLIVTIRRSKTDQEGEGQKVGIPYGRRGTCPVQAVADWMSAAGISEGPVFFSIDRWGNLSGSRLSPQGASAVVKRAVKRAGLDPSKYSGHSLRAGLATSAALQGVSERVIAKTTRHKSIAVLRGYIRDGELFRENAAAAVL